jgi:multidrug efflux pump subunit AcrA (membrane-fusion protein)
MAPTSPPNGSVRLPTPDGVPEHVRGLVEELTGLLEASLPPAEFYAAFLQRVLAVMGAQAGAVWVRGPQGDFQQQHAVNLAAVGLEQIEDGPAAHTETLRLAAHRARPFWVPPRSGPESGSPKRVVANRTAHTLFLAPVLVEQQVAGLLEVWQASQPDPDTGRNLARFLGEVAGFAAAYLHKTEWDRLRGQRELWDRLQTFARQVHGSLDPSEVACLVANEGRQLLGCDQLSVAGRRGAATEVLAVSGAPFLEKRSPLFRAMQALCAAVLACGEKLVYAGTRDDGLPPDVLKALDAFLAQSNGKLLIVLPLRDGREPEGEKPRSVLLAECFNPTFAPDQLQGRMELLAPHAAPALFNAVEHRRIPLRRLGSLLAGARDGLRGRKALQVGAVAATALALVALLTFVQIPLRLEARGELLPRERQVVYSTLNGRVVEMKAQPGESVGKGQELLLMEDLELQLQIEQLGIKVGSAEQRIAILNQQLGKATNNEERNALTRERVNQEYEMRKAAAERDILLQGSRNPRKTPVPSPLAGKVVTFDAQEQLVGKTVKPGDPLVRVARVQGPWEIELHIPEGHVGAIREGLERAPQGGLEVHLLLASQPHRTFRGRLTRDGLGGETAVKNNAVVLPARVQITDRDLLTQLDGMPVGVEVRAKVHCGPRAAGYVWFFDLWEFFFEHVLF